MRQCRRSLDDVSSAAIRTATTSNLADTPPLGVAANTNVPRGAEPGMRKWSVFFMLRLPNDIGFNIVALKELTERDGIPNRLTDDSEKYVASLVSAASSCSPERR